MLDAEIGPRSGLIETVGEGETDIEILNFVRVCVCVCVHGCAASLLPFLPSRRRELFAGLGPPCCPALGVA